MEKTYYALKAITPYGELFYNFRTMDLIEFNTECLTKAKTFAESILPDYTRHYPVNLVSFRLAQINEEQLPQKSDTKKNNEVK